MAISSSKTKTLTSSNNSDYTLKISFKENSTNVGNNTSNITVTADLTCNGYYWSTSYNSTIEILWYDNNSNSSGKSINSISFAGLSSNKDSKSCSGTINVTHKADGSLSGYAKAVFTKGSTTSAWAPASGNVSTSNTALSTIPRQANLNSAEDFNDTGNPKITYTNSAGNSVSSLQARIENSGGTTAYVGYRDVNKTGTSYTFSLTEAERNTLRSATPNSNSLTVKFVLRTIISGTTYYSTINKTMTIVNGNPTFTNFSYLDTNATVTGVTGNNQVLVKGLSTLRAVISSANKMVANKGATAKNYTLGIANLSNTTNYSTSDLNIDLGVINSTGTQRLNVRAYDSRNNSTLAYKDITVYDYAKPVINASITRLNNFENQTTLSVNGTYSKLTINNTDKNIVNTLQYRYRETNGTWGNWTNFTSTISNGSFSCNNIIMSLDNTKSFEFEIKAVDRLQTTTLSLKLDVGIPIFVISSNQKKCYINNKEVATLDKLYPVGSIYMSVNNTNPSTLFGGTWSQIASGRTLVGVNTSDGDFNTPQKTGGSKTINIQHSHTSAKHSHSSAKHSHGRGNLIAGLNWQGGACFYQYDSSQKPTANYKEKVSYTESEVSQSLYGGVRVIGNTGETTPGNTGETTPGNTGNALSTTQSILQPYFTCYIWCRTA